MKTFVNFYKFPSCLFVGRVHLASKIVETLSKREEINFKIDHFVVTAHTRYQKNIYFAVFKDNKELSQNITTDLLYNTLDRVSLDFPSNRR